MEHGDHTLSAEQKAVLAELDVVLCYVHGSVAMGNERGDSDVDIAVLFAHAPEDTVHAAAAVTDALASFMSGREIDVAILNDASPLLAQRVAVHGTLLYARTPEDELTFQIRAMHEYESSRRIVRIGQHAAVTNARL